MERENTERSTVSDRIIKTFLESLLKEKGYEEIAQRLEEAILENKPTEASIRSALFDEEVS